MKAKFYFWRTKEERDRVPLETQNHDSLHKNLVEFSVLDNDSRSI